MYLAVCVSVCVFGVCGRQAHLLAAALLQTVDHLLKLQEGDLHLLLQLGHKRLVLRVQVVVWLLCVQAESCRERGRERERTGGGRDGEKRGMKRGETF